MNIDALSPDTATGDKLAATITDRPITDKVGYAQRWLFSRRHVDNLIAAGLPCLRVGTRRVRIVIPEADAWMRERYGTQSRTKTRQRRQPKSEQVEAA